MISLNPQQPPDVGTLVLQCISFQCYGFSFEWNPSRSSYGTFENHHLQYIRNKTESNLLYCECGSHSSHPLEADGFSAPTQDKFHQLLWLCQCECGNTIQMLKTSLKRSPCASCGCATGDIIRAQHLKPSYSYAYNVLLNRAKHKNDGGKTDITYEKYLEFTNKVCTYCGDKINWQPHITYKQKRLANYAHWLDRKDNTKGYYLDNVVVCCGLCNYTKGRLYTHDEMLILGKSIKIIKDNRNGIIA